MRQAVVQRRQARLRELGFTSYRDYLASPRWRATKARYYGSSQPQECICGETEGLQLHHLTYERVGAEELTDLTPLCATCHAMIHVLEARGDLGLDFAGFVSEQRAARYAEDTEARRNVMWREAVSNFGPDIRVLQAMQRLRDALDEQGPQPRSAKRQLWLLRSRLDAAEKDLRRRIANWLGLLVVDPSDDAP